MANAKKNVNVAEVVEEKEDKFIPLPEEKTEVVEAAGIQEVEAKEPKGVMKFVKKHPFIAGALCGTGIGAVAIGAGILLGHAASKADDDPEESGMGEEPICDVEVTEF